jgi:hypothetical protein
VTARRLAALLALLGSGLALGCESLGEAGPGPGAASGSECIEGDDSHECEETSR